MKKHIAVLAVLAVAAVASAATYTELVTWSQLSGPAGPNQHYSAVIDGNTSYHFVAGNNAPRVTRVNNLNGVQTTDVLITSGDWSTISGGENNATPFYGFSISGNYLQFGDSVADSVYRIDRTTTGTGSVYVSRAQIESFCGIPSGSRAALGTPGDTGPGGEYYFWEGYSKQILKTNGAGGLATYVSNADLLTYGGASVNGALTFDSAGAMYWMSGGDKAIYKRALDGTYNVVLTQSQILAVTGGTGVSYRDMLAGPDGYVYFWDNTSANILRFPVANPAALSIFFSKADLLAGPAGSAATTAMYSFTWYQGKLAFHLNGTRGLFVTPEPGALALLGLGLLALRRR
jgi:hypothetical protein